MKHPRTKYYNTLNSKYAHSTNSNADTKFTGAIPLKARIDLELIIGTVLYF